jgi:fido (protein-threonine AMPylation protein)
LVFDSTRIIDTLGGPQPYADLVPQLALGVERVMKQLALQGSRNAVHFSYGFILELHRAAFGEVVAWAGQPRKTDVVVGEHLPPPFYQIPDLLKRFAGRNSP